MGGDVGTGQKRRPLRPGQAGQQNDLAARFEQLKPQIFDELSAMLRGKADPQALLGGTPANPNAGNVLPKDLPGVMSPAGSAALGFGKAVAPRLATEGAKALSSALQPAVQQVGMTGIQGATQLASPAIQAGTSAIAPAIGSAVGGAVPYVGPVVSLAADLGTKAAKGETLSGESVGESVGGAVGGAGGAGIGAGVGTGIGAAAGTVVPGIGNAIGALVGGLVGGAVGGAAGGVGGSAAGGAIGRASGGGKARIEQAGSPSPFGRNYTPNVQPFTQQ